MLVLFLFYILFLVLMFLSSDLFLVWFLMEASFFIFTLIVFFEKGSLNSLLSYFTVQSLGSMMLFISLMVKSTLLLMMAVTVKLALFPFLLWYMPTLMYMSPIPFILSLVFQKLPILYIVYMVKSDIVLLLFIIICTLSTLLASSGVSMVTDLKAMLVWSSLINTSWMLLMSLVSVLLLMFYMVFYMISLLYLIFKKDPFSAQLSLLNLLSLPPFPLFFFKLWLILEFLQSGHFYMVTMMLFMTFFTIFSMIMYLRQYFYVILFFKNKNV